MAYDFALTEEQAIMHISGIKSGPNQLRAHYEDYIISKTHKLSTEAKDRISNAYNLKLAILQEAYDRNREKDAAVAYRKLYEAATQHHGITEPTEKKDDDQSECCCSFSFWRSSKDSSSPQETTSLSYVRK